MDWKFRRHKPQTPHKIFKYESERLGKIIPSRNTALSEIAIRGRRLTSGLPHFFVM